MNNKKAKAKKDLTTCLRHGYSRQAENTESTKKIQ
jgi:hypothetical protein